MINSSWFRLAGGLDLEDWADPNDEEFFGRMAERGVRKLSTNHVCGQGYWVWLIQLSSGPISIGLCADPRFHPFEEFDTLEGVLDWFRAHEPQIAESVEARGSTRSRTSSRWRTSPTACKQVFSGSDRWCLVGEAGAFLDPFYSPGSDFIAMSNTMTTDLVTRSLDGEDVTERAKSHDELYLAAYRTHLTFYERQYEFWHNPAVMNVKIGANNILLLGLQRAAVLQAQVRRPRVHGARPAGRGADLGDHAAARGDVPRVERAGVTRVAARDGVDGRRSRRCSSGTRTCRRASTTTRWRRSSRRTPT